ncbi:WD40 repeat-like protein [Obba rivulosa]|uniref:WD40 repeat-like protein n=1 Tax=Obba rivulosa TaxID=1052685 RepID=A0A8E2DU18_9APHY|nr:WD40 repeat-like protein [Obba rivulosa]
MRAQHTAHPLPAFPVYSSAFVAPDELVLGGGGGQSRSGIKNALRLYRVENHKTLNLLHQLELGAGEDAPMSMAAHPTSKEIACGINSSVEKLKEGSNQNCRVYAIRDEKVSPVSTQSTLVLKDTEDDFQKVTVFSRSGRTLVVSGTRDFSVLAYPSLSPVAQAIHLEKGEIFDATFSSKTLVVATTVNLLVYDIEAIENTEKDLVTGDKEPLPELKLIRTIERPNLPGKDAGSSFRAIRFNPEDETTLYSVINTVPPRTRTKSSPRRAFVCKWNTETWEMAKARKVSDRGLTCFDVSPNAKFLAFGSSDYTVGVLDASTLAPLLTILKAHEFPPTTLRFNTTSSLLVSGSADNSVRVVTIPANLGATAWTFWILVIVTLLVILFAILAQKMVQGF